MNFWAVDAKKKKKKEKLYLYIRFSYEATREPYPSIPCIRARII